MATGLVMLAGVVMVYLKKDDLNPDARTHALWLIRTFWLLILWTILGFILIFALGLGLLILALLPIWLIIRLAKGVLAANDRKPIDNVDSWFI